MNEDKTTKHTDENTTDIVAEQVEQCALSDDACVQAADDLGIIDTTDNGPDERYAPFNERDNTKPERGTRVWSNVFFVVVIVLSLYFMYDLSSQIADGNSKSFADVIANLNPWYLFLSVGVLLVMMALDSLKYYVILKTVTPDKTTYGLALRVSLVGKYYDNITV